MGDNEALGPGTLVAQGPWAVEASVMGVLARRFNSTCRARATSENFLVDTPAGTVDGRTWSDKFLKEYS